MMARIVRERVFFIRLIIAVTNRLAVSAMKVGLLVKLIRLRVGC